jgi:hypothetical protein
MRRLLRHVLRLLPAVLSLGLLAFSLRSADFDRALALVAAHGPLLPLLLVPQLCAVLLEVAGWWLSFARLGPRPPYRRLFAVRVVVEGLSLGLPSGTLVAESMLPWLLKRRCSVPSEHGIVATVARKSMVILSHGLFLGLATFVAWPLVERASRRVLGGVGLPALLLATALLLVGLSVGLAATTALGGVADRLRRLLDRHGGRWLETWLERNALRFRHTDEVLQRFFRRPQGLLPSVLLHLLAWVVRALETYWFLRLLDAPVPLLAAFVMEPALVLVRALAVPVPAGIGVQDLGYLLCLRAIGLPDAVTVGAAFVLLKRGRDLAWILAGFTLLGIGRDRRAVAARAA